MILINDSSHLSVSLHLAYRYYYETGFQHHKGTVICRIYSFKMDIVSRWKLESCGSVIQ